MYKENPKTQGSGILCCIPQKGLCPNNCPDCFFQSNRSYLEPLEKNLPNMPPLELAKNHVVRVNDGNDSNVQKELVLESTKQYPQKFYNTSIPDLDFPAPVVLTSNPGKMTDEDFHVVDIPKNLMFVRFRTNMWNLALCDKAVRYYTHKGIPIILTFMAYYESSNPELEQLKVHEATGTCYITWDGQTVAWEKGYIFRKRTLNSYWAITTRSWRDIMTRYRFNKYVHSCGYVEGELGDTHCRFCGNCLLEYYATMERIKV